MSAVAQFKKDFDMWEWRMLLLNEDGPEGVAEIREQIRTDWGTPEKRTYWLGRAANEAKHSTDLQKLGLGIVARIKAESKKKRKVT